jgi:hypothetical protein
MAQNEGSYNGLSFGPGTDYGLRTLRWWRRSTNILTPDLPRYHGGLVGASYETAREVEVVFMVSGNLFENLDTLFAAFQPRVDEELPFVWEAPGLSARRINLRPVEDGMGPLTPGDFASGVKEVPFRLVASDPAIYDDSVESETLPPFTPAGGFSWPAAWPISWGAAGTGGTGTVTLGGDWESWPTFTISGPSSGTLTNPIIENVSTGDRLALNNNGGVSMSPGQSLIIETHPARRSIAFSTGASRRGKLSDDSDWFPLLPGANQLRFRASGSTTDATVLVEARTARI